MSAVSQEYIDEVRAHLTQLAELTKSKKIDTLYDRGVRDFSDNTVWVPVPDRRFTRDVDTQLASTHVALAQLGGGSLSFSGPDQVMRDEGLRTGLYVYKGSALLSEARLKEALGKVTASDESLAVFAQSVFDVEAQGAWRASQTRHRV